MSGGAREGSEARPDRDGQARDRRAAGAEARAQAQALDLNSGDAPAPSAESGAVPNPMDRHSYYVTGRRIVLWRHGQTEWNMEGRLQGQTDVPLDKVGREQAQTAARLLQWLQPSVIVSSDLSRAVDTARALATLVGLEVTLDKGLRETFVGTWQGLTDAEIKVRFPEEYAAWREDHAHQRRGGGEIESEVAARAVAAIERALETVPNRGTLVVVTHGGTARVTIGRLLGLPEQFSGALGGLSNCSWSVLGEGHRGWRLLEHNAGSLPEPVYGDDR
jgi:glucosyl-3-phosphoglycerate phosphatase